MRNTLRLVLGTVACLSGLVASQACDSALELPFWEEEQCKASNFTQLYFDKPLRVRASYSVRLFRFVRRRNRTKAFRRPFVRPSLEKCSSISSKLVRRDIFGGREIFGDETFSADENLSSDEKISSKWLISWSKPIIFQIFINFHFHVS